MSGWRSAMISRSVGGMDRYHRGGRFSKTARGLLSAFILSLPWAGKGASVDYGGPVSDLICIEGKPFAVSPAGISQGTGEGASLVWRSGTRLFSLAELPIGSDPTLVVGGGEPGVSGEIGVFRHSSSEIRFLTVSSDLIYDLDCDPRGRRVAYGCADGTVLLGGFTEEGLLEPSSRYKHTAPVRAVEFSADGRYLASAGLDGLVLVLDLDTEASPLVLHDHSDKVECLMFTPDSSFLISGARDGRVRVHSVNGRLIRSYAKLGDIRSGGAWPRVQGVLSLTFVGTPPSIIAGTSGGGLFRLSVESVETAPLDRLNQPITALAFDSALFVGSGEVRSFDITKIK